MADPGWAARTPEDNDLLLKAGTGVGAHLANQTAWTMLAATHHASGVASAINTAATSASWLGAGSAASATNVTMLNASLHGLAGWVDVKPAVVSTAISAYQMANCAMRPAPECIANRDEWGVDNGINPIVLGALTPRIVSLDVQYFGVMWPTNSAVGASYGAILTALAESLAIAPPVATMGASPAAPAEAASAVSQAAADSAAGDGMRAAYQGVQAGTSGAGQSASAGQDIGSQASTFMEPVQSMMGAVPQALQAPMQLMQAPMSAMQPLQSMMGMFANPARTGRGSLDSLGDRRNFRCRGWCIGRRRRRRGKPDRRRDACDQLHPPRQCVRARRQRSAGRAAAQRGVRCRDDARADHDGRRRPRGRYAGRPCSGGSPRIP